MIVWLFTFLLYAQNVPAPAPVPAVAAEANAAETNVDEENAAEENSEEDESAFDKVSPLLSDIIERYEYDSSNKRDVFKPYSVPKQFEYSAAMQGPIMPLQRFTLDELQLVGIIWGGKKPMGMVTDGNKIFYVKEKEKIGNNNGYIARIREGELVVIEEILDEDGKANYITRIMKILKKN